MNSDSGCITTVKVIHMTFYAIFRNSEKHSEKPTEMTVLFTVNNCVCVSLLELCCLMY